MSNFKYKLNQKNAKKNFLNFWFIKMASVGCYHCFTDSQHSFHQRLEVAKYFWLVECVWIYMYMYSYWRQLNFIGGGCPRGVMVKAMDCGIVVSEFKLQSRYYVHKYPWGKVWTPLSPSYGLNSTTTVFLEEWLWYLNNQRMLICH